MYSSSQQQSFGKTSRPSKPSSGGDLRRVYVGNLPFETAWQDLKDHMKTIGPVVRADILTEPSGRSKGCGIVEYASARDAQTAIAELNNSDLNGRSIFVREDREGGATHSKITGMKVSSRSGEQGGVVDLSKHVYVGNLSWDVSWQDLKDHMKRAGGTVLHADVLLENSGRSKGCGLVEFASVKDATNAILKLNDTELKGRPIFIREDREVSGADIVRVNLSDEAVSRPNNRTSHNAHSVDGNRLYVGNLDYKTKWFDLKDHFRTAGEVVRADVAMEGDGVRSKGYGIVEFATAQDASNAIAQLNDSVLNGRQIFVREDREGKQRL